MLRPLFKGGGTDDHLRLAVRTAPEPPRPSGYGIDPMRDRDVGKGRGEFGNRNQRWNLWKTTPHPSRWRRKLSDLSQGAAATRPTTRGTGETMLIDHDISSGQVLTGRYSVRQDSSLKDVV
jgi:hypothetical protein